MISRTSASLSYLASPVRMLSGHFPAVDTGALVSAVPVLAPRVRLHRYH